MAKIVLIRHGYSQGNKDNILAGWSDVDLTNEGVRELRTLKKSVSYPVTDLYFSSDLLRCRHTFDELFGDNFSIHKFLPEFREIYFGEFESYDESQINFKNFFENWLSGKQFRNEETLLSFSERVKNAFISLCFYLRDNGKDSATVVTHSGVIRCLILAFQNKHPSDFFKIDVPNGLGYEFELELDQNDKIIIQSMKPLNLPKDSETGELV